MKPIFEYNNYRQYLKDYYAECKRKHRYFSYRYFAKKAGSPSSSWLLYVMKGKRNLTESSVEQFVTAMKLSDKEATYFRALVRFNQAQTTLEKDRLYKELLKQAGGPSIKIIEKEQFEFYSKWYHHAIREMISLNGFKENPVWIAKKLKPTIKPKEARRSLTLLEALGFIKRDKTNKWVPVNTAISTGDEVRSHSVREFHRQMIGLAKEAIDNFESEKREISSLTASFSEECFTKLKKHFVDFENELIKIIEDDKNQADKVYQMNFQMFPLIQERTDGDK